MSDGNLARLAERLEPHHRKLGLTSIKIYGDRSKLHVGAAVGLNDTFFNTGSGHIHIGDYTFFGHGAIVLAGSHLVDRVDVARHTATPGVGLDIVIGRGVWIASGAIVIGPCRIGDHAVIGAGSVVLGDVADGWLYAGNPARPIRPVVESAKPFRSRVAQVGWLRALVLYLRHGR